MYLAIKLKEFLMFDRSMKQNKVETSIPEFWFSRHMGVIWKLYVDDIFVLIVYSGAMLRVRLLFFIKNTLEV